MARGRKREGAGRRKGPASPQRKITESIARKAAEDGVTPLDYMLGVMRECSKTDPERADKMAIAAAKFMHAMKTETTLSGGVTFNITPFDAAIG